MRRALYWIAVVVALTAVAGGGAYAYVGYRATSGPDGAVKGYFAALARSDAPAALAFGDVPAGPHELLTSAVLAQQQRVAPLHGLRILDVAESGGAARVRYSYELRFARGDQEFTGTLSVVHRDGGWRLTRTAVATTVRVTQANDRIAFAGAGVPDGATLLFPGALPVRVDTPNLQIDPSTAAVQFGGDATTDVRIEPTAVARTRLLAAVRTAVAACVRNGAADPSCPLPAARIRAVPGSLHGTLVGDLARQLTVEVGTSASGTITLIGRVTFRGTYRRLDYVNVAHTRTGTLTLPVDAEASAVSPLVVRLAGSP